MSPCIILLHNLNLLGPVFSYYLYFVITRPAPGASPSAKKDLNYLVQLSLHHIVRRYNGFQNIESSCDIF